MRGGSFERGEARYEGKVVACLGGSYKSGERHLGDLFTQTVGVSGERYKAVPLRPTDPITPNSIPELYEPVLTLFAALALTVRMFDYPILSLAQKGSCRRLVIPQ